MPTPCGSSAGLPVPESSVRLVQLDGVHGEERVGRVPRGLRPLGVRDRVLDRVRVEHELVGERLQAGVVGVAMSTQVRLSGSSR